MKAKMGMVIDTTWGNGLKVEVESELDNAHDLTTNELSRLMVYTLSVMVSEARRESERELRVRESPDVTDTTLSRREVERYAELTSRDRHDAEQRERREP